MSVTPIPDPTLGRIPRVLVPVELDAMVLRSDSGGFADCLMQTPQGAGLPQLLPPPFSDLTAARHKGIYLQWALPDALTRQRPTGTAGSSSNALSLPAIPDRWLILRLALGATPDKRALAGWVIEASTPSPTVTPLAGWTESGTLPTPGREPTALGHGDLAWAAYYDNVVNRLAFYDALDDGARGPLAYVVCGWYADPALDPLAAPATTSLTDFYARMADLEWALPGGELEVDVLASDGLALSGTPAGAPPAPALVAELSGPGSPLLITDGSWWPQSSLFHGAIVGLGWPDPGWPAAESGLLDADLGGPPDPADTAVAFGTSTVDALGALMVGTLAQTVGEPVAGVVSEDEILEAFQVGLLGEIDHPDGRARLDAALHSGGFHAIPGGQVDAPTSPAPRATSTAASTTGPTASIAAPAQLRAQRTGSLAQSLAQPIEGDMHAALAALDAAAPPGPVTPADPAQRSLPRWFRAQEPAVVVQGARRSAKHGADGRFTQDGTLVCRLSGFVITSLSTAIVAGSTTRPTVVALQLLEEDLSHPGLPPECVDVLHEAVLLDPGSARAAALTTVPTLAGGPDSGDAAQDTPVDVLTENFMVEQTVWWALRDSSIDAGSLLTQSGLSGTLPSPMAITPPADAWAPRHLDWELEVFPSAGGLADWSLGELDLSPNDPSEPAATAGTGTTVSGRSLLTAGVAQAAAAAGRAAIEMATVSGTEGVSLGDGNIFVPALAGPLLERLTAPIDPGDSDDSSSGAGNLFGTSIATQMVNALGGMDVLACTMDGIHATLRGEPTGQVVGNNGTPPPPTPNPDATGLYRPVRLRLVDGFGQVVNLLGSGPGQPAQASAAAKARTAAVAGRDDVVALPPRFTAPSRALLRFVNADPSSTSTPPPLDQVGEEAQPVCGFVLPDHLDGALEFFDIAGNALGAIRPGATGENAVVWDDAPGSTSPAGRRPSLVIPDPSLGAIADALLTWGSADTSAGAARGEGALQALLRLIDSTLWTVDPAGHVGDEHLSLLIGHPVVVLRATLRVEVNDPLQPSDTATAALPVRIGALAHWDDGVLAFFARDDYSTVYSASPAAAHWAREVGPGNGYLGPIDSVADFHSTFAADLAGSTPRAPITHPFVNSSPVLHTWPGQDVPLTVLAAPHSFVHATSGVLPRKEIGMRREWVADGLARIAPTFRFGPVLVDPATVRMPVPTDLPGSWTWDHRADAAQWASPEVVNDTGDAALGTAPASAQEGWLQLHPPPTAGTQS
jgi:hypothetical protein